MNLYFDLLSTRKWHQDIDFATHESWLWWLREQYMLYIIKHWKSNLIRNIKRKSIKLLKVTRFIIVLYMNRGPLKSVLVLFGSINQLNFCFVMYRWVNLGNSQAWSVLCASLAHTSKGLNSEPVSNYLLQLISKWNNANQAV